MSINDEAKIYLQPPIDKVEYIAHVLLNTYKTDARTWYDLARAAVAGMEKYEHLSRKVD